MRQKITMNVQMNCEKCRTNAMKIAAAAEGVISVSVEGENTVVVRGDEVDVATLTQSLRKKLRYASLLTVEEDKPNPPPNPPTPPTPDPDPIPQPPAPEIYQPLLIYESSPPNCSLM